MKIVNFFWSPTDLADVGTKLIRIPLANAMYEYDEIECYN